MIKTIVIIKDTSEFNDSFKLDKINFFTINAGFVDHLVDKFPEPDPTALKYDEFIKHLINLKDKYSLCVDFLFSDDPLGDENLIWIRPLVNDLVQNNIETTLRVKGIN